MFFISIIGSFFGGMAALFAPCCVTILFPLYLGTIFKQTTRIFMMTVVFALGIAAVILPISLGVGFLSEFFHIYHKQFYIFGGVMLILVGAAVAFGIKMPMPHFKAPSTGGDKKMGFGLAFVLGVFSGISSACCAPVLIGSMTLAVASGAFFKAILVSFFYIIGMVFPLFIMAFLWNKLHIFDLKILRGKTLPILAGILFVLIGIMMFYLGATGNEFWAPEWQSNLLNSLKDLNSNIINTISNIIR